jgi:hypothetical protein
MESALVCLLAILLLSGCGATGKGSAPPPNPMGQTTEPPPGSSTPPPPLLPPLESRPMVLDFPDVPVPQELSRIDSESFVFQSGNLAVGLMTLRGLNVDTQSIINFYRIAMPRENWKPRGGFNAKKTVLIFEKPDKTCVINVYEKLFRTYVEVYLAPMTGV